MCLPTPRLHRRSNLADLMGVSLSLTCLVHCLALPLLLLLAPALSHWITLPEGLHAVILLLALPAALIAMRDGWRNHRRIAPLLLTVTGLALLATGLAGHEGLLAALDPDAADRWFTSAGAISLAVAHLANWQLRHGVKRPIGNGDAQG